MRLKKLTVYDVNAWLKKSGMKDSEGRTLRVHATSNGKIALVKGAPGKGNLVINTEGISEHIEPMKKLEIELSPVFDNGSIAMFPTVMLRASISEMKKSCPKVESEYVSDFIRKFGARLECNFASTLRHMRDIGIDSTCYHAGLSR